MFLQISLVEVCFSPRYRYLRWQIRSNDQGVTPTKSPRQSKLGGSRRPSIYIEGRVSTPGISKTTNLSNFPSLLRTDRPTFLQSQRNTSYTVHTVTKPVHLDADASTLPYVSGVSEGPSPLSHSFLDLRLRIHNLLSFKRTNPPSKSMYCSSLSPLLCPFSFRKGVENRSTILRTVSCPTLKRFWIKVLSL